jgi:hypothetical protein
MGTEMNGEPPRGRKTDGVSLTRRVVNAGQVVEIKERFPYQHLVSLEMLDR